MKGILRLDIFCLWSFLIVVWFPLQNFTNIHLGSYWYIIAIFQLLLVLGGIVFCINVNNQYAKKLKRLWMISVTGKIDEDAELKNKFHLSVDDNIYKNLVNTLNERDVELRNIATGKIKKTCGCNAGSY